MQGIEGPQNHWRGPELKARKPLPEFKNLNFRSTVSPAAGSLHRGQFPREHPEAAGSRGCEGEGHWLEV